MFITLMQKNTTGIFPKEKFNRGKNLWHIKILQKKKNLQYYYLQRLKIKIVTRCK